MILCLRISVAYPVCREAIKRDPKDKDCYHFMALSLFQLSELQGSRLDLMAESVNALDKV